jgi:hypothetical protein
VLNHCTKYLARDTVDARHSYLGTLDGQSRSRHSDSWRFPIVDASSLGPNLNDVTFVVMAARHAVSPTSVEVLSTCHRLYDPIPLQRVESSTFWARTVRTPSASRYRYKIVVDGVAGLDPINPQTETLPTGEVWSSFFTYGYAQPVSFERWELALIDRLTRHILPFTSREARNFIERHANGNLFAGNLYRLDISLGVANFIDNVLAREERHRLVSYKTCLELIDLVLRRRYVDRDPEFLAEDAFVTLYNQLASNDAALFSDGWDATRFDNPAFFLWLLRRHAFLGAFTHPKYGGNASAAAWAYLSDRYSGGTLAQPVDLFDWRRGLEKPIGTNPDYRG